MNPEGLRVRLTLLAAVVTCLFAALFARLWYLQFLQSRQLKVAAQANGVRLVYTPAPRGRILDAKGRVLVDNTIVPELTVDRATMNKHPEVLGRLAALLSLPAKPRTVEDLRLAISDPRFDPVVPVPVAQVDTPTVVYVREHPADFPGVQVQEVYERVYPHQSLAAHLLGYVGEINETELTAHRGQGYRLGDQIGKSGVEKAYELQLRGQPGITKLEVNSAGKVIGVLGHQDPVQGRDMKLTVDLDIQALAEQALAQGLAAAQSTFDRQAHHDYAAPAGAVVVLDPRDGSVRALASYPSYDPSQFVNGIPSALFRQLNDPNAHQPLENRVTAGLYAPGSTFKLVTATAALTRGLITPASTIVDGGAIRVGNQVFHNSGGFANGRVNVTRAITVSSDVFFYTLGEQLWNARAQYGLAIQDTARLFGLGQPTGIATGDEAAGRVPGPDERKRLHQQNPAAYPNGQWYTGDNVNLAIGQGELVVTPLQLANAYAAFANGGTVYVPRVALDAQDQNGTPVTTFAPHAARQIAYPPGARDAMLAGFEGVPSSSSGTAYGAFLGWPFGQIPLAAKTGTAQVNGKEDTSVFTVFAPATDPQYEVTVFEEQAGFGASAAAPSARRILEGIFGLNAHPVNYVASNDASR